MLLTAMFPSGHAQNKVMIDGDEIILRDTLDKREVLLTSIKRGPNSRNAIWITYDRRPNVDPWITESPDKQSEYSDENFINYWRKDEITILGVLTTYDDCHCSKHKMFDSPDMYLIHFKISPEDWIKMKELYPEIEEYLRKIKY